MHFSVNNHAPVTALLAGKVVAITGATSGIGRGIALEMARHGAKIAVNYYDKDPLQVQNLETLRAEIEEIKSGDSKSFTAVPGDISIPETGRALVRECVAFFGRLDVFVSNAGICPFYDFLEIPEEVVYRTLNTNFTGAYFAIQAAARQMKEQGDGGSIIGISSISALVGGGEQTHYTPTKAGILSLMQSCAVALGKYGIRCNALLPGTIKTAINEDDLKGEKGDKMAAGVPLGRLGVPEDLAGPAVFLASDLSRYVTGAQLLVDGGLYVNLQ
ncbi:peroxisomal 2,4-dienoyl-CoA reductase, auxiliary enzyme of fatty acid beta-oxidation [Myxozyma melibiosi]|uniref:Peroxisomal 2,4-dienoyl-CoA reductase, auxiliary enzyme of fatty acid beta-oxidation n=1 Tax=Myxozyma melibiosi TaxID=54550 RepID=A0ABR1F9V0_9ASCO